MPGEKAPDGTGGAAAGGANQNGLAEMQIGRPQNDPDAAVTPYCFVCGKTPVQLCFNPDGPELERLLKSYFIGLKQGEGIP